MSWRRRKFSEIRMTPEEWENGVCTHRRHWNRRGMHKVGQIFRPIDKVKISSIGCGQKARITKIEHIGAIWNKTKYYFEKVLE